MKTTVCDVTLETVTGHRHPFRVFPETAELLLGKVRDGASAITAEDANGTRTVFRVAALLYVEVSAPYEVDVDEDL